MSAEVVFEKEVISYSDLKPFLWHLKAHTYVQQGCFFFLSFFSCAFDDQLSPNFHRFVILCLCWDTPSENTDL